MLWTKPADAGEIEPRAYVNTPEGINFLLAGYAYSDGGLATPGSSPIKDSEIYMNSGVLAYARTLDIRGNSGKFDVIMPYARLSGSAMYKGERHERYVSGFGDMLFRFSFNFFGAPALPMEDFIHFQQDLIIGASVQVSAPVGQYDSDKLVNLGNNRWFIKPDIGISKAWGPLTLELSTGVLFFSKNCDYLGDMTLEQDPVSTSQIHVTYNCGHGIWVAGSWTHDYGGRTSVDGVKNDDTESNTRAGFTLALPVNKNNSIKVFASTSLHTHVGSDVDIYGAVWQCRWGRGL